MSRTRASARGSAVDLGFSSRGVHRTGASGSRTKQTGTSRGRPPGSIVASTARRASAINVRSRLVQDRSRRHAAYHRRDARRPRAHRVQRPRLHGRDPVSQRTVACGWSVAGCRPAPRDVPALSASGPGRQARTLGPVSRRAGRWSRCSWVVVISRRHRRAPGTGRRGGTDGHAVAGRPGLAHAVADPVPSPAPTTEPTPTDPGPDPGCHRDAEPNGDARLRYAEFLLRVNDDRETVEELNVALGRRSRPRTRCRPLGVGRHPRLRRHGARLAARAPAGFLLRRCPRCGERHAYGLRERQNGSSTGPQPTASIGWSR